MFHETLPVEIYIQTIQRYLEQSISNGNKGVSFKLNDLHQEINPGVDLSPILIRSIIDECRHNGLDITVMGSISGGVNCIVQRLR